MPRQKIAFLVFLQSHRIADGQYVRSILVSHRGTVLEAKTRASMFESAGTANGGDANDGAGAEEKKSKDENDADDEGGDDDDGAVDPSKEEKEKAEQQKKLSKEAQMKRMRQRMRQNAVVTNFITTLKGDLQKAAKDVTEIMSHDQGADKKKSTATKVAHKVHKLSGRKGRKKKTERDIYTKLNETVKKAIKELEGQLKDTVMASKERDQFEDYLAKMLAERDAKIPDEDSKQEGGGASDGGNGDDTESAVPDIPKVPAPFEPLGITSNRKMGKSTGL